MHRIDRLVFWMGGVITRRISQATIEILAADGNGLDADAELAVVELEKGLCSAIIEPEAYCRRAVELTHASITTDDLIARIPERLGLTSGISPLLDELSANYPLHLVSAYPRQWLLPAMQRMGLFRWFGDDSVLSITEHGAAGSPPVLFDVLVASGVIILGRSLWVDHNPIRTSAAIRRGIDAAVFVNAQRLRRDLTLWDLVPQLGENT